MTLLAAASTSEARVPSRPAIRAACCAARTVSQTLACVLVMWDPGSAKVCFRARCSQTRKDAGMAFPTDPSDVADITPKRTPCVDQDKVRLAQLAIGSTTVWKRGVL